MKFLFTAGGSQATVFSMAPLATAARNAGHEILVAVDEPLLETAEAIGVPAVLTPHPRMTSARLGALLDLAEDWPPDLVVSGLSYVPGLLAARRKVPYVRQYWDIAPLRAEEGLQLEVERLGLAGPPDPALFIDVCPPCLRSSRSPGARPMRWIPRNRQRRLEPWMYIRPQGRPRVLITSGTHFRMLPASSMRHLVDQLALAGAEVVIAAPERAAEELGTELGDVPIGWIPLDVVAPTCDLAVHHGGAATAMTFMNAGVPQLVIPDNDYAKAIAQAVCGFGAALTVMPRQQEPGRDLAEVIAASCREILSNPRYAKQAQALASEVAALPTPAEMVLTLETLAAA
jgi:glycosyltransferase